MPIVSGGLFSGFGGGIFFSVGGAASGGLISGVEIVSAVIVDPTADFARAAGVLSSPEVEAIGTESAVTALSALGAGAPASAFNGATGLNESRIFCAAATSWARM